MNHKTLERAVNLITTRLLTPLLYKAEDDEGVKFIGFFDTNMDFSEIEKTEISLSAYIDIPLEIIDIREFESADILHIINNAELVYSMHPTMENYFKTAITSELEFYKQVKKSYLERRNSTGTFYVQ